ncbi:MAG: plasmid mobilization protein [Planctomycetota bacterium]|jgi:hypothetical protein
MSRISIDVTPEEHKKLKAMAALQGKSIKEFVLESTIGAGPTSPALAELEALLDRRIRRATAEGPGTRTVGDVFRQARDEAERGADA